MIYKRFFVFIFVADWSERLLKYFCRRAKIPKEKITRLDVCPQEGVSLL